MTDAQKKMMEMLGITEDAFKRNAEKVSAEERLTILEDAFAELCEEVLTDG